MTFNSILCTQWPEGAKAFAFADDDATFIVRGHSRHVLEARCNDVISQFDMLCNQKKLRISELKSKYIIFHKPGQTLLRNPCINLRQKRVKRVKELKLLGLLIDEKLSWLPHLRAQRIKAHRIASRIKGMQGSDWGLRPHILKIIYSTVVEKILIYGAAIWALPMTTRKQQILNSVQRPFVLAITRAYRTTATAAATVLAGLIPLHIRAQMEAVIAKVTLLKQPAQYQNLHFSPEDFESNLQVAEVHPALFCKNVHAYTTMLEDNNDHSNALKIYTDGSQVNGTTGCSYTIKRNGSTLRSWKGFLGAGNSVFQAEAEAIRQAILAASQFSYSTAEIHTDSLSAIHAIRNPFHRSPIIGRIQQTLHQYEGRILIFWIKAHAGHQGNEEADLLAKEAASNLDAEQLAIKLPKSY
ncbi:uncharacterized protein LOC118206013, partial [Stegodyphus dumicola]|uniref:uncharacterized protein LOC118206013 n=1 Tax=Stegodyphus dumicola TaxID=202533 RepID=UPI0015B32A22